jgi:hypothetical protein
MADIETPDRQRRAQRTPQPQRREPVVRGSVQQRVGYGDVECGVGGRVVVELDQFGTRA